MYSKISLHALIRTVQLVHLHDHKSRVVCSVVFPCPIVSFWQESRVTVQVQYYKIRFVRNIVLWNQRVRTRTIYQNITNCSFSHFLGSVFYQFINKTKERFNRIRGSVFKDVVRKQDKDLIEIVVSVFKDFLGKLEKDLFKCRLNMVQIFTS